MNYQNHLPKPSLAFRGLGVAFAMSVWFAAGTTYGQNVPCAIPAHTNNRATASAITGKDAPVDGLFTRKLAADKPVLAYQSLREADVIYEKRIWRVIDLREKINLPFAYPKKTLIEVLIAAASEGKITAYGKEDFTEKLTTDDVQKMLVKVDTVPCFDGSKEVLIPVTNDFNPETVKRFRLKEVWFFDKQTSTLGVRIIGIAPIQEVYDDKGNLRFEQPMFWLYYPAIRKTLSAQEAFNPANDGQRLSWEDVFEMRYFSSYVTKESNVYDRRIQDYKTGSDALREGHDIEETIRNYEHDVWQN